MLLEPKVANEPIHFIDLKAQQLQIRSKVDEAIQKVLNHGCYIMGPEVAQLEADLSDFCGAKHSISCSNGTDALGLGLMAKDVQPGDAIFAPSFTFCATGEVVSWTGATPIFIDVLPDTFNMDPASLEQGIAQAIKLGLKPRGIIPVDLFGQPADYDTIAQIAEKHNLWIMADAAQSFGATYKDKSVGTHGHMTTTSFFPAKPLGCYGDGGAIFTDDDALAAKIKSLRVHGQGSDKYDNVNIGINGRLDTLQAAILIEKLKIFSEEIKARQAVADRYSEGLSDLVQIPFIRDDSRSVWAQYTFVLPESVDRSALIKSLKEHGVPSVVYYVKPLHLQTAYKHYPTATGEALPTCEHLANHVLSLPMHPYLVESTQNYIIETVRNFLK